jgi:hypothetical protein
MAIMSGNKAEHPAKVRVAIRVGVTGHRPNRLKAADQASLRLNIEGVLKIVRDATQKIAANPEVGYDSPATLLRVISPLAEGADRLVADEALKLGFELQCALPFRRDEYELDFATPESRKHFRDSLKLATAVLELDGSRDSHHAENIAYENVGRTVLRHSDVLIAIWDGEKAEGKGGTTQIVKEALQIGIPVVWIHAESPHPISLLLPDGSGKHRQMSVAELPMLLNGLLNFRPAGASDSSGRKDTDLRKHYFGEKRHTWTLGVLFRLFSSLTAGSWPWPLNFLIKEYEKETKEKWDEAWAASPGIPPPVRQQVEAGFLHHFAWADKLADHYANIYRSSFLVNYLLAAFAVLFALRAYFDDSSRLRFWIGMELGSIVFIIVLTRLGRKQRWHERWIDYRLLAEKLRQMRFLFLIGRGGISNSSRARDSHDESGKSWVNWHFDAVTRAAGLPQGDFDRPYREEYRKLLTDFELPSQVEYHAKNFLKFQKIDRHLHWVGTSLFFGTLVVCIAHLLDRYGYLHGTLVQLAAVLPSFGAALHGIGSQGDFHRVAQRSGQVNQRLNAIMSQLKNAPDDLSSNALGEYAERAAAIMGEDLVDWRAESQEKQLVYPS